MRKLLLYMIAQIMLLNVSAQQPSVVDTLLQKLDSDIDDTSRVNTLNQIAADIFFINPDEIKHYADEALLLSESIGYQKGVAQAYNNLGIYYRGKGIYDKAIDYFFNSLQIMEELEDEAGIARSYNLIGILYYYLDNNELSLEYYKKALAINEQQNDKKWIAGNSNNIGMIYERMGEYDLALAYYLKAIEMSNEMGNKNWLANHLGNLGSLYMKLGHPESLKLFKQRLEIKKQLKDTAGIAQANFLIGDYFVKNHDYTNALPHLLISYEYALKTFQLSTLSNSSQLLSETYAQLGKFEEAYNFNKLFKNYSDSLDLQSNTEKIMRLTLQNEFREEQQIDEISEQNSKIRQILIAFGLVGGILLILYLYWRQRNNVKNQVLKQEKLELENQSLQDELDSKDRLMSDNIHYVLRKNELLTDVIEKLNRLKSKLKSENQRVVNSLIFDLQAGIQDNTWEEFELRFNQVHNDFYQKLNKQFPELTASEKRLCAFLKLKMTSREISSITGQTIKSIETARTRLRKKLKLVNKDVNLSNFLHEF